MATRTIQTSVRLLCWASRYTFCQNAGDGDGDCGVRSSDSSGGEGRMQHFLLEGANLVLRQT